MNELTFTIAKKKHLQARVAVKRISTLRNCTAYFAPQATQHLRLHRDGRVFRHFPDGPASLIGIDGRVE